ncbi:triacylglycerol lipase [Erythrobacter sp. YT30]|uniref:esterase/lipase family protein n=1 Tax=Erythrobacter sp. YT30 TaxID=1735012 RepID=UPI00076DC834|nr:alpha/beta hydrolase [Erythrobacter sp. YT30]KWV90529.1 alpha/beta hydrolase [Erythrobacter sp. YT30]
MASIPISDRAAPKAVPPKRIWTLAEGRAMFELGMFYASRRLLTSLPKGDGHAVMCLPGFMASNSSTIPMRGLLRELGYDAHGWDSGRNIRVDNALLHRLEGQLLRLHKSSGRKVSLIGWSLGGVLAREIAKLHPDKARLVISLGSPISNDRNHTNARKLFERLNGKEPEPMRDGRFLDLETAPPLPTTSIYTKTDGVVHWHGSLQAEGEHPSENIEVHASHLGLGVNPSVMVAMADRLSQAEGKWAPFRPSLSQKWMFPRTKLH